MKKFAYHRADYKAMNEWLAKVDWNCILGGIEVSIDEVWERFVNIINNNIINEAVDNFVPISKKKRKCGMWMTRNAMRAR